MDDVSRETPAAASAVFPADRLPLAERYADLLATEGVLRGLIGPREGARLWPRHLLSCGVLGRLAPPGATVCDVGSGAGLPGMVVALARPDVHVTLVEPLQRRTTFLEEVVSQLGLDNVEVVRGRADLLHGRRVFEVVTSRAVAPLPRLLEWSMPLVSPTGVLLALKGASAGEEVAAAEEVIHRWALAAPKVLVIGEDVPDGRATVVRVAWADPARVGWPLTSGAASQPAGSARSRRRKQSR